MTRNEFTVETSKLEQFFNKELNDVQRQQWYYELKRFSIERYREIVREAMKGRKFMPSLAEILEIARIIGRAYSGYRRNETVPCAICNGDGAVRLYKIIDGHEYEVFAKCTCQNARNKWADIENMATFEEAGFRAEDFLRNKKNIIRSK